MRLSIRCLGFLGSMCLLLASLGAAVETETVKAPEGKCEPVLVDGVFSPGEWDDAWQKDLGSGVKLYLKKIGQYVFVGVQFLPFKGSNVDLFISPDGRTICHFHASAQIGELWLQANSPDGQEPEFIWGDTSDWYANEIRWNQKQVNKLVKEGRNMYQAQDMSLYRYDGFEFQIRASKFPSKSWLIRLESPMPPDWERFVFPAGTTMKKTDDWLRLDLD